MSTAPDDADLARIATRAGELLADGGHRADGDEVRAAAARIDAEVMRRLHDGAPGVDAALHTVATATCDRLATRLLQGRPLGGALHEVAVLHAALSHYPASWFAVGALDGVL